MIPAVRSRSRKLTAPSLVSTTPSSSPPSSPTPSAPPSPPPPEVIDLTEMRSRYPGRSSQLSTNGHAYGSGHSHGHARALRTFHRSPPRPRRALAPHWRQGTAAPNSTAWAPARHAGVADAVSAYAAAGVCLVCAGVVAWGIAGISRAVYADVGRKTRARAAEFAAAAAQCAHEWEDNDCGGRPGTSAVGRMCREWGACMERGKWAEWDAVSGVVWAEAISECGRAFVDGVGGVTGVASITGTLIVLVAGFGVVWRWISGRRQGDAGVRSWGVSGHARRDVDPVEEEGGWTEVIDDSDNGLEDGDRLYGMPRLPAPARILGGGNKMVLTPRRPATLSISRLQQAGARR